MIGKTILHYRIIEEIGRGGMGVVYKAVDTKLDRLVALKFLPHHLTGNEAEKARFLQEAKAAAALNHPNVCSVIDIVEHGDQQFIVMEYVDGVTLRQKAPVQKMQDAVQYAIQIGEALQAAHAKGIVHRDVKCENIMLTSDGRIKVMDFGLAKLKGSLKLTRTSSTVGTLAYMAPEQIQGGEVDARSDIFSFGVVLFELITGKLPFRGEHEAAIMYSIMNEEPLSMIELRPDLSPEIVHIVEKAMEKDPAERYQSSAEMAVDLRRAQKQSSRLSREHPVVSRGEISKQRKSSPNRTSVLLLGLVLILVLIGAGVWYFLFRQSGSKTESIPGKNMLVVLPFENLGSPDQEYFADGMTEEITTRLSGLSGLAVIARSSAMQYKKSTKTLQQIGDELHVAYALQGTIRWGQTPAGMRVRVSPALIKISDATQVWSEPYEAMFSDVFKMQSEIATEVAGALGVTLLQPERKTLETHLTDNSDAYNLYVRGDAYFDRSYRESDFRIAIDLYEKAVAQDPKFAQAYAHLSRTHSALYWFHYDHTEERIAKAKEAVDMALKLNPDLPEALEALGYYYYWDNLDYDNALREFTLAEKSRPNDGHLIFAIGAVQRRQGKFDLAVKSMEKACELDPRSSEVAFNMAQTYQLFRDYPGAEREYDRAITLGPDVIDRYTDKTWFYLLWDGTTRRARLTFDQVLKIAGADEDQLVVFTMAQFEILDKHYQEALKQLSSYSINALDNQFQYVPKAQSYAETYGLMNESSNERKYYDSARIVLEAKVKQYSEDARYHSALGITYAGLGRKDDAIREAKRGVELLPISKEAWRGAYRVRDLAYVYLRVKEYDAAIDQLRILFTMPSDFTPQYFRLDPRWASLSNDPRFQKLLAENK
jgi:serine/threonine protein kinase/tetratricopeptide (TPR) repeat protein